MDVRALALTVLAVAALGGCGDEPAAKPGLVQGDVERAGHVHGLAVDGEDLLIATHSGVWRATAGDADAKPVGESRRDVMGFAAVGDRLVGSGHPDPLDPRGEPANVGVIESRDDGVTWQPVALAGEVDFHALTGSGRSLYGYDGGSGRLLVSDDAGTSWRPEDGLDAVISLAADPERPRSVLASTPQGVMATTDGGSTWRKVDDAVGIVASGTAASWSVDAAGTVRRSVDAGRTWTTVPGKVSATPVAVAASPRGLVVALEDGSIVESIDDGASFRLRVAL